jgi:hypothetical protein
VTGYRTGTGQDLVNVHSSRRCRGSWCVIHNPMPGPWSSWPTHWRSDAGIMERICPCGVGHPVVEGWFLPDALGVHGCCGKHRCYMTPQERAREPFIDGEIVDDVRELES